MLISGPTFRFLVVVVVVVVVGVAIFSGAISVLWEKLVFLCQWQSSLEP